MNLITVIPLSRSKIAPELTYFTGSEVIVGSIVTVPLRSKSIHAIVTKSVKADEYKSEIKNAAFQIRKLNEVKATVFFPPPFIEACKDLAEYYATTVGAVIDTLVSDSILENVETIVPPLPVQASLIAGEPVKVTSDINSRQSVGSDRTLAIQGDDVDRISSWRSLIRQEFARKKSLAFYVPTIEDCETLFLALEKGIEGYIFILNSSFSNKEVAETWAEIAATDHPIVLIATGSFSLIPRGDVETIVIERESGRGWISQKAPYMDVRHALETIARHRRQTVFIADCILRTETLYRLDKDEIDRGSPFKWRSISSAVDTLVDMRRKGKGGRVQGEQQGQGLRVKGEVVTESNGPVLNPSPSTLYPTTFRILSPELEALIKLNREDSTHLFILTIRRGTAPMTVCDDCETIVLCTNCSAPITLHASVSGPEAQSGVTGRNYFMCHRCGQRRSAEENCANCGGWRLTPLGIGIDRVYEEIRNKFPGLDIFKIDADSTKTEKQLSDVLTRFRGRPGSVILGTELAMSHLTEKIDHIAIASLDSLFALPDFRIQEKVMYTLVRLRAQAVRSMLVQTRKPEEKVFEYGLKGNLSDFYRATLADRKLFNYPPFCILIKVTIEGKKDAIAAEMASVQELLGSREMDIFPAFTSTVRGKSAIHGLLRVESHAWPDTELIRMLRSLPPNVSVKVNPESLL